MSNIVFDSGIVGDSLIVTDCGILLLEEFSETFNEKTPLTINSLSHINGCNNVKAVFNCGLQDILEINTEYGIKIKATPNHEFLVMDNGELIRRRADQLKIGDLSIIMLGRNIHGNSVDLPNIYVKALTSFKDINLPSKISHKFAKFLGYFISEGRIDRNKYQTAFGFGLSSTEMMADFEDCFRDFAENRITKVKCKDSLRYSVSSKKLYKWLEILGVGKNSAEKCIPRCIRSAPWEFKREFLRSYFEGDGTNKKPTSKGLGSCSVSATSKSELLIRQIQAELANVDILGYIHSEWRVTDKGKQEYWTWTIRRYKDLVKFKEQVGFISSEKQLALENAVKFKKTDVSNRYLDGVEKLLLDIYSKVKMQQKEKLREVLFRTKNKVRFGDTRLEVLSNVLPDEIKQFQSNGIWTAKISSIAVVAEKQFVYNLLKPESEFMVVGCNVTSAFPIK